MAETYVTRNQLEQELRDLLVDERHPVISLVGRGGIGKTSLALKVLRDLCEEGKFKIVFWFSARDIDLLPEGPKEVKPQVVTFKEIADGYRALYKELFAYQKDLPSEDLLARALARKPQDSHDKPILLVVDNFETVRRPTETYNTLNNYIHLLNKVLITGRHREFKADYPLEVPGMRRSEYDQLVADFSIRYNKSSKLDKRHLDRLYDGAEGHPYVIKVFLGKVASGSQARSLRQVLAPNDNLLEALFERSYKRLSPGAQWVFLTLCNWRSLIVQLEREGVLRLLQQNRDYLDVSDAVDSLERYSMIDVLDGVNVRLLRVPEAARVFGKKKLSVSHLKPGIDVQTKMLQRLGAVQTSDKVEISDYDRRVDHLV